MTLRFPTLLAAALLAVGFVSADPVPGEDPAHQELRALKTTLIAAVERGDIEAMLPHLHPEVVITWQNSEVCRGHDGVRAFFARMQGPSGRTWQGYKVPPTPDALTTLHAGGAAGVVTGHNVGQYHLLGKEAELPNRWTATVVQQDGRWLLASYHISMNVLDNPLLNATRSALWVAGGVALVAGLAAGFWLGRRGRKA